MTFRLRPILILLALAVLNQALCVTYGIYSRPVFFWTIVAFALGMAASLGGERIVRLPFGPSVDGTILFLAACAIVLTYLAVHKYHVTFNDVPAVSVYLKGVARAGFLLALLLAGITLFQLWAPPRVIPRAGIALLLLAVLATGFTLRALVILASREPIIDVYNLLQDSADFILQGKNPYAHDYHSPYHTERAQQFHLYIPEHPLRVPGYPPLAYLFSAVPRLFGADVRWAHAVMDTLAALGLFLVALRRNQPLAGLLAASLYLHLPGTVHVTERAWYEPFLAGLFGMGFWLVEASGTKSRILGHILLGLAFTGKQYGAPMYLPFAWIYRRQWRYLLLGLAAGLAVILPFVIWSPADFVEVVIMKHMTKAPGFHSVTILSALNDVCGWYPPPVLLLLFGIPLLAPLSWRAPAPGAACALTVGTALFTYVLFSSVGFFNSYYLAQFLWLLGFIGLLPMQLREGASTRRM
jgi:hypothetical protein